MKGDLHVRFRENVGVKFPHVTRLAASGAEQVHFASEKERSGWTADIKFINIKI